MPKNYYTVFSAFHSKTFSVVALMLITAINTFCTRNSIRTKNVSFEYAESLAHVVEAGHESFISRQIYISPDGTKVVNSNVKSETSLSGIKTTASHTLSEYLISDSLFIYDSSDSTFLALSVSDLDDCKLRFFTISSAWLLCLNENDKISEQNDTLTIAGYRCKKILTTCGYHWNFGNQPMGRVENIYNCNCHESILCFTDTILSERLFARPAGFRKVVPAD